MTSASVVELTQNTIWLAMELVAPILATALAVGLVMSIIQTATQLNDITLTFVPKMIAAGVTLWFTAPFLIETLTHAAASLLGTGSGP